MIDRIEGAEWRKSSRSASNAQCVETHHTLTQLRDSKNATGPTLHADVAALVAAVKAGRIG
jgi:hypothetical protein